MILFSTKNDDKCEVDRIPFLRDVAVFLVACALVLVLSLTEGNLTSTEALALIGIYLVYVAAVVTSQYVNCGTRNYNIQYSEIFTLKNECYYSET